MGESWFWIKQRPHFIAGNLASYGSVSIFCEKRYKNRIDNQLPGNIKLKEIYKFPLAHNKFFKWVNEQLHKKYLFKKYFGKIDEQYDLIWINIPKHFDYIKKYIGEKQIVVYDCMDDILEFKGSTKTKKIFEEHFHREKSLFARSNVVFCSSEKLKENLLSRYGYKENIYVVNNGIYLEENTGVPTKLPDDLLKIFSLNEKSAAYIGTISEWFDFDLVIKCLDENKNLGVILVGPNDVEIPAHPRLYKYPPVEYHFIKEIMKSADVLIMPFKVTGLVKAVNPVKLYEYIYSCVPAISISYGETEKFKDYVFLYKTYDEFANYIKLLFENNLKIPASVDAMINFAKQNTWEIRTENIIEYLKPYIKSK